MPFCTFCGKEAPSGKKFCEYCGAPLESPAAPAAPVSLPVAPAVVSPPAPASPAVAPPKPAGGSGKGRLVAGVVVILILIAAVYFIGLPMLGGSKNAGTGIPATTAPTPKPIVQPITYDTAVAQETAPLSTPSGIQTYEEKYTQTYKEVYSINQPFVGGQKTFFVQDLPTPPLYIKFNITPEIEVGEKIDEAGHLVSTSYISPNSWFTVRIYDAGNGVLVEEQGFNKGFSVTTRQEFMVRVPGNYRVEISGNDVIAEVRILTG
jgi:hypothetical protein